MKRSNEEQSNKSQSSTTKTKVDHTQLDQMDLDISYLDATLAPEIRTERLITQMTLEEKVGQMMQISCMKADPEFVDGKAVGWIYSRMSDEDRNDWVLNKHAGSFLHVLGDEIHMIQSLAKTTRLGIPVMFGIDAIHGHALHNGATVFPSQLAASCSWDREALKQMGRVTAKEVAADGIHMTFSPVLCIARDLRWGRVGETFGEDPYLIGELGSAIIKGYQGETLAEPTSILACAKHYLAYGESIGGRDSYDTQISFRKARETFLPPFEKAIKAGCLSIMTGYQSIDGTPATANQPLIKGLLKDELDFTGFIITDWNNTESLVTQQHVCENLADASKITIESGNDMIMNTPAFFETMVALVKEGRVTEATLDDAVRRILLTKFKMGLFEKVHQSESLEKSDSVFACDAHLERNLELTRKSIVLLENKNELLPIGKKYKKIAVIGPSADDLRAQYGDWTYFTHPFPKYEPSLTQTYTVLKGIEKLAKGYDVEVNYQRGCDVSEFSKDDFEMRAAIDLADTSDLIIAVVGDTIEQNGEFKDRANLDLMGEQQVLLEKLKATGKPMVVVLVNGKPLSVPWIKENADAVIETFNSGQLGGLVLAEILFGECVPSGKLSISFPYHVGQLPVYYNQLPGWHGSKYIDLPMMALYPFGYGLSYTTFEYTNLRLSQTVCVPTDRINVSVEVTNTGQYDGDEIVQLYVSDLVSSVMTPFKMLKGFERVKINRGETKVVTIELEIKELAIVDASSKKIVEPGAFKIWMGSDSRETSLLVETLIVK